MISDERHNLVLLQYIKPGALLVNPKRAVFPDNFIFCSSHLIRKVFMEKEKKRKHRKFLYALYIYNIKKENENIYNYGIVMHNMYFLSD